MYRILLFIVILFFSASCKAQKQDSSLKSIAEVIGSEAIIGYNQNETYALVQDKASLLNENTYTSRYLIIRLEDNQVLKEGSVVNGYIKWIDKDIIEIYQQPGIIKAGQKESDFKKQINVSELKEKQK